MNDALRLVPPAVLAIACGSATFAQETTPYDQPPYGQPAATADPYAVAASGGAGAATQATPGSSGFVAVAPEAQGVVTPVTPATADPAAAQPTSAPAGLAPPPGDAAPGPPAPPFQLTEVEQQFVFRVLTMWEVESAKIKTYNAKFDRLEFDAVWGPGSQKWYIESTGSLSYSKPDKGSFKIDEIRRWTKDDPKATAPDAPGTYVVQKDEVGEHWVCDGKAVYEYEHRNKQLVVTPIPEPLRGKSIVDGPLPFLFGAEAKKLAERYWIRSTSSNETTINLEAYPRRQADAANYDRVDVILDRKTMQPTAIQVHLPGGQQRHVYTFHDATVNGKLEAWFGGLFSAPRTPLGWKKVVVQDGGPGAAPQAANPDAGVQR